MSRNILLEFLHTAFCTTEMALSWLRGLTPATVHRNHGHHLDTMSTSRQHHTYKNCRTEDCRLKSAVFCARQSVYHTVLDAWDCPDMMQWRAAPPPVRPEDPRRSRRSLLKYSSQRLDWYNKIKHTKHTIR